jgi:hypothetical protein
MKRFLALVPTLLCGCSALIPAESVGSPRELALVLPGASRVQLVADWNQWGGAEGPSGRFEPWVGIMTETSTGTWTTGIPGDLPRGRYRYAFLVDGFRVVPDPLCPDRSVWKGLDVSLLVVR